MKKTFSLILAFTILAALLAGCGSTVSKDSGRYEYPANEPMEAYTEEVYLDEGSAAVTASNSAAQLPQSRKWIITMKISSETEDLDNVLTALQTQIQELGGYIEDQYIAGSTSYRRTRSANLTVRIPADKVDSFSAAVSQASNVTSTSRNVTDVTLSYTDTESRITALRAEETRLLELMAQAEDMTDLLAIEARLTEVRYQLESYTSQLRKLDNQIDYATISLSIQEVQKFTPVEKLTIWQRIQLGFSENLSGLFEDLGDLLVGFISSLPYLVVLGAFTALIVIIIKKCVKRSKAKRIAEHQKRMQQMQAQNQQNQV